MNYFSEIAIKKLFLTILCVVLIFKYSTVKSQSIVKLNGLKINMLDKKQQKQGNWIFFDSSGNVKMNCFFKDDINVGPFIFYENSDTAFVKFPVKNSIEEFILYEKEEKIFGSYEYLKDSLIRINIDDDIDLNGDNLKKIKKYQSIIINPNYAFSQQKITDYISASFSSSDFVFNKKLVALLTINASGVITNVEFPKDKNNLSGNEERELYWIYFSMPRWQPFFYGNKFIQTKVMLGNNFTISVLN